MLSFSTTVESGYFEVIGIKKDFELSGYIEKESLKKTNVDVRSECSTVVWDDRGVSI